MASPLAVTANLRQNHVAFSNGREAAGRIAGGR